MTGFFRLSSAELSVLLSVQHWLTQLDISATANPEIKSRKQNWLSVWEKPLFGGLVFWQFGKPPTPTSLSDVVKQLRSVSDLSKRTLILCECLAFSPYFNIQSRGSSNIIETIEESDRLRLRETVLSIAENAEVNRENLEQWISQYETALRVIGGRADAWDRPVWIALALIACGVTGGTAAPAIGGMVGAILGLTGATSTVAGLTLLGSGVMSSSGVNIAAMIGGGALLEAGSSITGTRQFNLQHKAVVSQLAKLEASMIVLLPPGGKSKQMFSDAVIRLSELRGQLLSELDDLKKMKISMSSSISEHVENDTVSEHDSNELSQQRKRLTKVIGSYEIAMKRLNDAGLKKLD